VSGFGVELRGVGVTYDEPALHGVDLVLAPGAIHGLLGRNGSGKTTLLSLLAAFRRPDAGTVLVDGEDPFENERVLEDTCFVRESGDFVDDENVKVTLDFVERMRPRFDRPYAEDLLDQFEVPMKTKIGSLSRGQQSAVGASIGLATRAPLTILDEVYLGMDAPSRYRFYQALLSDYVAHPRTVVLSSHLIGELDRVLEHVTILDRGGVLLTDTTETLQSRGVALTGPTSAVDSFLADRPAQVLARTSLGGTTQVTLYEHLDAADQDRVRAAGVDLGPVPLQDLVVHLTDHTPDRRTEEADR
jgi:ABC-2 type transport system ATP-binding protein